MPFLSSQPGNRGVLFFSDADNWITQTIWQDQESIDRLNSDPEYERIVSGILALGVLGSDQKTNVYEFENGSVRGFD